MTALGVFWGIFMLTVLLGAGMGLGRLFRAQLGDMSTNTLLIQPSQTSLPLQGHAQEPLVAHEQRRRGKRPGAQGGAVRLGRLLGRGDPLQLQRTQGRLFADGLHARLPADQPTEDHLRPLHQRRRHGAEAQGLRHRHPDTERPVSGNGRPDRQGHQSQQQLFHHYRRHAAPEHGHVVQQRRTHGRSP